LRQVIAMAIREEAMDNTILVGFRASGR